MNAGKRPRAFLVITGSELVRGDRTDRNGPWLAQEVLRLGFEPARIDIVGDSEDELEGTLRAALGADLCVVSGGLGPTHDDRTVELVARAADAGGEGDGVEATICARDFEIHVDLLVEPGAQARADELVGRLLDPLDRYLFARTDMSVAEVVLDACRARGLTLATAESCTGGMVAERLTAVPGASDVFVGSIVAYADGVKTDELAVSADALARYGAVSAETAAAMAEGVRRRLEADGSVGCTGH